MMGRSGICRHCFELDDAAAAVRTTEENHVMYTECLTGEPGPRRSLQQSAGRNIIYEQRNRAQEGGRQQREESEDGVDAVCGIMSEDHVTKDPKWGYLPEYWPKKAPKQADPEYQKEEEQGPEEGQEAQSRWSRSRRVRETKW